MYDKPPKDTLKENNVLHLCGSLPWEVIELKAKYIGSNDDAERDESMQRFMNWLQYV